MIAHRPIIAVSTVLVVALLNGFALAEPYSLQDHDYSALARLPDWSGAYALDQASFAQEQRVSMGSVSDPLHPALTPKYEALREANGAANGGQGPQGKGVDTNSAHCLIDGMPGMMTSAYTFEFLFTPGRVTIINDAREVRRIYTDGRIHNRNADASFEGDSIGHWEGSTLVADTVNILAQSQLFVGMRGSGKTHVQERIFKRNPTTMEDDITVSDPVIFARPWHYVRRYQLNPLGMSEYVCEQDNRDSNGVIDLTPPPN